jgi:hypothetical protein
MGIRYTGVINKIKLSAKGLYKLASLAGPRGLGLKPKQNKKDI